MSEERISCLILFIVCLGLAAYVAVTISNNDDKKQYTSTTKSPPFIFINDK